MNLSFIIFLGSLLLVSVSFSPHFFGYLFSLSLYLAWGYELGIKGFKLLNHTFYICIGVITVGGALYGLYGFTQYPPKDISSGFMGALVTVVYLLIAFASKNIFLRLKNGHAVFVSSNLKSELAAVTRYSRHAFWLITLMLIAFLTYLTFLDFERLGVNMTQSYEQKAARECVAKNYKGCLT